MKRKAIAGVIAAMMLLATAAPAFAANAAPGNSDFVGQGGKQANSTNNFAPASRPGNS